MNPDSNKEKRENSHDFDDDEDKKVSDNEQVFFKLKGQPT